MLERFEGQGPIGFRVELPEVQTLFGKEVDMGICVVTCPHTVISPGEVQRVRQEIAKAPAGDIAIALSAFEGCPLELAYPRWQEPSE